MMMRIAITLCVVFLQSTCGYAASSDRPASSIFAGSVDSYRPGDTADHVRVTSVASDSGDKDKVIVTVQVDAGFHINANPASLGYLIPTTLNVTNQAPLNIVYPRAVRFKPKFADDALDVYERYDPDRGGICERLFDPHALFVWHGYGSSVHRRSLSAAGGDSVASQVAH
jgi:hypothetical protein